ncbi:MAG: BamA/TamA family outer membrane protein, partial [Gemmatimonadota bacterium]
DLAGEVDIHGTDEAEYTDVARHEDGRVTVTVTGRDEAEVAEITRSDDGRVTLTLTGREASASDQPVFYHRTFLPAETNEVRLYLGGGDDFAIVRGTPSDAIAVRLIGEAGDDVLIDSAGGGGTHFYDSEGETRFVPSSDTRVSVQHWIAPEPAGGLRFGEAWKPDWGGSSAWGPALAYAEGGGLIVGFGPGTLRYGFRRLPYHWQADAKLWLALGSGQLGVSANADYRAENSPLALTVAVRATQFDALRFYGYGNDTPSGDHDRNLVEQKNFALEPMLVWHIGWRSRERVHDPLRDEPEPIPQLRPLTGRLDAGPVLYWSDPTPQAGSPAADPSILGVRAFGRVGFRLGVDLDRTDADDVPTRGWTFQASLAGYPQVWSAARSFSLAAAAGSVYLPILGHGPHLALRAGGGLASGSFPVQHAPTVGGRTTLRGYRWRRYTGDTSAYGSAELRWPATSLPLFLRWQLGVFGLADAGRVWFDGESDGGWHTAFGGGFWLSALGQSFSFAYARGE